MNNHTTIVMNKVLKCYKGFKDIKKLVDVGGGLGININLITSTYPHMQGINFDLPHVIKHAPSYPGMSFKLYIDCVSFVISKLINTSC